MTAAPYDQLTSKQILDVQSGTGEFDVFDYFYFGLGDLVGRGRTGRPDRVDRYQQD